MPGTLYITGDPDADGLLNRATDPDTGDGSYTAAFTIGSVNGVAPSGDTITTKVTVKDLSARLSMSLAAMSRAVEGLVQRGFVARRECESDRRSRQIALLPQGREVLDRVIAAREAALVEFASELSDAEREGLSAALLPIAEKIPSP